METNLIIVAGTDKYPFACVIEIDNIWVTDRICNKDNANRIVEYAKTCTDFKQLKMKLALFCVELRMNNI